MKTIRQLLAEHPFVADLSDEVLRLLEPGASEVRFETDDYLFREHEDARAFYLIIDGSVAIKINIPTAGPIPIQTLTAGQVLGWSWFIPPYKWHFDARAFSAVGAIALEAGFLRTLFEQRPEIGYRFLKKITAVLAERLQATRLQLLDVYQATE